MLSNRPQKDYMNFYFYDSEQECVLQLTTIWQAKKLIYTVSLALILYSIYEISMLNIASLQISPFFQEELV